MQSMRFAQPRHLISGRILVICYMTIHKNTTTSLHHHSYAPPSCPAWIISIALLTYFHLCPFSRLSTGIRLTFLQHKSDHLHPNPQERQCCRNTMSAVNSDHTIYLILHVAWDTSTPLLPHSAFSCFLSLT